MKRGGGKAKGASFERKICQLLSLWVSHGKNGDCFWRSAMSGGRATIGRRSKNDLGRQAGDISAISREGHKLTEAFFIECKHVRQLSLSSFLFDGHGLLGKYWTEAKKQAYAHGKSPMLIAKQNMVPVLVLIPVHALERLSLIDPDVWRYESVMVRTLDANRCEIRLLSSMLKIKWKKEPSDALRNRRSRRNDQ